MGKILITGATGNVGRYTAEYLLGAGEEVKAASKSKDKAIRRNTVNLTFSVLRPLTAL